MIKHVYLFKLKPHIDPKEVARKLYTLKEKIPAIHEIEVGFDFRNEQNSYDLIECCTFLTMEDFRDFIQNDYHDSIRKYMKSVQESGIKIDYEILT